MHVKTQSLPLPFDCCCEMLLNGLQGEWGSLATM